MKDLQGTASALVSAPPATCLALLEAVDRYPIWHPEVVKQVEVLERDGQGRPMRISTTLHLERGPLAKDFVLLMGVVLDGLRTVRLIRLQDDPDEERFQVTWVVEGEGPTQLQLQLDATLSVPRVMPLGGVGDAVAEGFVAAAVAALS